MNFHNMLTSINAAFWKKKLLHKITYVISEDQKHNMTLLSYVMTANTLLSISCYYFVSQYILLFCCFSATCLWAHSFLTFETIFVAFLTSLSSSLHPSQQCSMKMTACVINVPVSSIWSIKGLMEPADSISDCFIFIFFPLSFISLSFLLLPVKTRSLVLPLSATVLPSLSSLSLSCISKYKYFSVFVCVSSQQGDS